LPPLSYGVRTFDHVLSISQEISSDTAGTAIKTLTDCGVVLSPEATVDDLFMFHSREEHGAAPYKELIPTLGFEMERDSFAPLCNRLWMCDYERVEDHGAYADVISRLHQMSEQGVDSKADLGWSTR
jgi:hypothetical protein